jgi:hypothetical protein
MSENAEEKVLQLRTGIDELDERAQLGIAASLTVKGEITVRVNEDVIFRLGRRSSRPVRTTLLDIEVNRVRHHPS